uniref:Uncharacterized protein n=1 Tax=Cucumis melo TaxID=3656 RepID=A0A9I9D2F2_CUCME
MKSRKSGKSCLAARGRRKLGRTEEERKIEMDTRLSSPIQSPIEGKIADRLES